MIYPDVVPALFLARPNRFIAEILIEGAAYNAHVKNTGRCRELLVPGCTVYVQHHSSAHRKTAYSLIAVDKNDRLINMDSQAPNRVVAEAFQKGFRLPFMDVSPLSIRPEVTVGDSRLDFLAEYENQRCYIEVKGVTLEEDGVVRFPDAPTDRGVRHLRQLCALREEGYEACALFVIQMEAVSYLTPNDITHPAFGDALREAADSGVHVLAYSCTVTPDSITLGSPVPVRL